MFQPDLFRQTFRGGGARPTLFNLSFHFPLIVADPFADQAMSILVKSASIPGMTDGIARVPFFGRDVKLSGDREFENWTVTIVNDEDFAVRNAFERWFNAIKGNGSNSATVLSPNEYQTDFEVNQYSKIDNGVPIKRYQMVGAFPVNLGEIELNYDARSTIEQFNVTFAYQYWNAGSLLSGFTTDVLNDVLQFII